MKKKPAMLLFLVCAAVVLATVVVLPGTCDEETRVTADQDRNPAAPAMPERLVQGDPKALIVQAEDLPGDFSLGGGEHRSAGEYSQIYFNPQAYLAAGSGDPGLLGVIANLVLSQDAIAAADMFTAQGGLDAESVMKDIRRSSPGATPLGLEPHAVQIPGTDRVLAFRVHYVLHGTRVYEYRYRFLVGNALGNLIISARGAADDAEPPDLAQQAKQVVDRQVARLNDARP